MGLLGDVERGEGHYDAALALYRKARAAAPRDTDLLFAQVEALAATGADLREALGVLEHYLATQGENVVVLNRAADLLLESGDFAEAARRVRRSAQLDPNYWKTRVLGGRILLAEGHDARAIGALEEAIRLNPRDPEAYNWLATLYRKRGKSGLAEATYRRLLRLNPGDPQTTNNLADLCVERRQFVDAVRLAREALSGAPRNPRIQDTLGWALELAGRSKEAAPHLDAAHTKLPDEPEALLHWAINLRSRGRHEEARGPLQRVVLRAPDSASADRARKILGGGP
jgi:tetratricopeptide (TPR) repeat protein